MRSLSRDDVGVMGVIQEQGVEELRSVRGIAWDLQAYGAQNAQCTLSEEYALNDTRIWNVISEILPNLGVYGFLVKRPSSGEKHASRGCMSAQFGLEIMNSQARCTVATFKVQGPK